MCLSCKAFLAEGLSVFEGVASQEVGEGFGQNLFGNFYSPLGSASGPT